ncbi:MAG: hypothetical protein COT74_05520 [Bdellovibrionales bacterium CG10_big_fil_rev_8_21_14_0_10_45_34]|nr:MAG: hypothetical protein COT74_05520 [Bdellovibrionales bacterium CG10_big_fil_rev_8_21_14_0_10_45_34]
MAKFFGSHIVLVAFLLVNACATTPRDEQSAALHMQIGAGHLENGNYPAALKELQIAAKLDPNNAEIQNNLALAYFVRERHLKAEEHLKRALEIDPKFTEAKNNLARTYHDTGQYDACISMAAEVVKDLTYSTPEKGYLHKGMCLLEKGKYAEAKADFLEALKISSSMCTAQFYIGQIFYRQNKFDVAAEGFDRALKMCQNKYPAAHYFSALARLHSGHKEEAIIRLEEVTKIYPESDITKKAAQLLKAVSTQ